MKKLWKLFLVMSVLVFAACGGKQDGTKKPEGTPGPAEGEPTPEVTAEPAPGGNPVDGDYLQYTFNLEEKHQKIDGFGGAFTWYSDQVFTAGNTNGLLDAAFTDAKMSVIRFKNEYSYHGEGNASNVGSMLRIYEAAVERAAKYGEEPTILLSCWSPPARLKSNQSINGGGSLAKHEDGTYMYEEYASW